MRNERKPNGRAGGGGRERHVGGGVHGERSSDAGFGAFQFLLHRFIREVVAVVKSDLRMRSRERSGIQYRRGGTSRGPPGCPTGCTARAGIIKMNGWNGVPGEKRTSERPRSGALRSSNPRFGDSDPIYTERSSKANYSEEKCSRLQPWAG